MRIVSTENQKATGQITYEKVKDLEFYKQSARNILGSYGNLSDEAILQDAREIYIGDKLVGYISFSEYDDVEGYNRVLGFGNFMVLDRGKGYGTRIIKDLISKKQQEYDLLYCFVDKDNTGAINLYKKLGTVYTDQPTQDGQYYVTFFDNPTASATEAYEESLSEYLSIEGVNSPEQLLDWMRANIEYELREEYYDDSDIPTKTAQDVLKTKKGNCAEQSYLEKAVLDALGYETQLVFIKENSSQRDYGPSGSAHVFLIYKDERNNFCWFEHAMEHARGIHKYQSLDTLLQDVADKWWRYDKDSDILEVRFLDNPITGVNNYQLAQACYDYPVGYIFDISNNKTEDDMITVKTRKEKVSQEAFKGHIDSVQELRQELLKQLPESELWDDLGKRDELHCTMPATRGLNPIKSIVRSILANSVLDADVKVEEAAGTDDWIYVSITKIKEDLNKMQAFEQVSVEDLKDWGDEEVANQDALSSIAEAIKQSLDAAGITYSAFDFDIFDTGSTICIQGVENPQEVIEFLEEHFEFPIVDEGEDYVVINTIQGDEGKTHVNTNYLTNEEPDEDAKKLKRIKEEIYYYLGREVSDEEALEVLDFAEAKPYADLSEIVSDYFNQ